MKNINSKIERYKSLKSEVDEISKEIKNQEKLLNKAEFKLNNYFENNIIKLRLGDLIDNLSLILKVKKDDINYKIDTSKFYLGKLDDMKLQGLNGVATVTIFTKDNSFNYKFNYMFNLEEKQFSGKNFLEHCTLDITSDFNHKIGFKTSISINKDIDDIIVKCDLNTLSNDSKETNIIIQALNKCDNLNEEKVKKLGGNYE